jgi:hypothetical protein
MIALLLSLLNVHPHPAQVTPESVIITPDFDAVWVPDGMTGPIVAAPFEAEVFEVTGG